MKKRYFGIVASLVFLFLIKNSVSQAFVNTQKQENSNITSLITHDPIDIDSDDDFITLNCPGTGEENDPYIIENYNITTTGIYAMRIQDTTKFFIVRNCYLERNDSVAVRISDVATGTATIINNTIKNNRTNTYSTMILGCSNVTISNNTIRNGSLNLAQGSQYVTITNNTFEKAGIFFTGAEDCLATYNIILKNGNYGAALSDQPSYETRNNIFHHNIFIDNAGDWGHLHPQAYDTGSNNIWHDSKSEEGNYWSEWVNYTITGYTIYGGAGSVDPYPLNDTDHDGLTDEKEIYNYKTNPFLYDTDGDGFSDGEEINEGTNPNDPGSHPETKRFSYNHFSFLVTLVLIACIFCFSYKKRNLHKS